MVSWVQMGAASALFATPSLALSTPGHPKRVTHQLKWVQHCSGCACRAPSVQDAFFLSSCQACRSTLLRAIGQGLVVGFPKNLHALYVQQLEGTDGAMSVLDTVMQADKEVLAWRQHAALLQVRLAVQCTPLCSS